MHLVSRQYIKELSWSFHPQGNTYITMGHLFSIFHQKKLFKEAESTSAEPNSAVTASRGKPFSRAALFSKPGLPICK